VTQTWPPPPPQPAGGTARRRAWWRVLVFVVTTGLAGSAAVGFFVFEPRVRRVEGRSMWPTFHNDDRLWSVRILGRAERGDIVGLRYPLNTSKLFVSRIVGLPGERISIVDGVVRVGDTAIAEPYLTAESRQIPDFGPIQLGADEYFVLGDNRRNSSDSREWGPVRRPLIRFRIKGIWWRTDKPAP
jgi:signal peptidase I